MRVGPFYICLSSTISFIFYLLINVALVNATELTKLVGWIIYLSQISSYTYTFLVNPGLPNKSCSLNQFDGRDSTAIKICNKCGIIVERGRGVVHCDDCGVCIMGKL